ncbi:ABC transporter permease [Lachnospiraceae bacterium ZAX-1]
MKRFINDLKKYYKYAIYSAKSELKSEIANSHLSWLWWILDPLLFMLVYTFISVIVFDSKQEYFPVFVFIGLAAWTFFEKTVKQSVKLVTSNKAIVTKVYIPKHVLIFVKMYANGFKMLISFALVAVMMVAYRIPITYRILYMIPIFITLALFTFGAGTIMLHFGVFVEDLANVINVLLRLLFYVSGIFYSIQGRVKPYGTILLKINPIALILNGLRDCMIYSTDPDGIFLLVWFAVSVALSVIGLKIIYKYENSYVKVI